VTRTDAFDLAADIRARRTTAREVALSALQRIRARDPSLNCFTAILAESALREAEAVDSALAAGLEPGPLAGVPFAVKNLFDVAGLTTLAGSKINAGRPPAARDATASAPG
jgi:aspartyl-tRNA(Asn)/glutamyl-tRNA(Gln) amidotransferase subunit A